MESLNTLEISEEQQIVIEAQETVCQACGAGYTHPLTAKLISGENREEYCACPRCLNKVTVAKSQKIEVAETSVDEEEEIPETEENNEAAKPEDSEACSFHLGYLKKRPKNSPIPDSCFVCSKMIDCTR